MKKLHEVLIQREKLMTAPLMGFPGLQLVRGSIKLAQQNHILHYNIIEALFERFKPDIMFPMMDLSLEANALGRETDFPANEPATILRKPFIEDDFSIMRNIDILADARISSYLRTVQMMSSHLPDSVMKAAYVCGPFTLAALIKGADDTAMATMLDPDNLKELIAFCNKQIIKFAAELIACGAELICILEPTASLLSPALFSDFSGKYISEISAYCRQQRTHSVLHICGNTMPFMDVMGQTDIDAVSLDSKEAGVDLQKAAAALPEDIAVIGNICPTGKILTGTTEEVEQEVRELVRSMQDIPRFVLSTGCDLPQNVPLENIEAFMKAGRIK